MNLCGSLPNHKNRNVYDGTLPYCLSEARRAGFFLNCLFQIHRGGDRLRAAVIFVQGGVQKKIRIIPE